MSDKKGNQTIADSLVNEQGKAKLPEDHTKNVMQRINITKVFKDLFELMVITPTEVLKSFNKENKGK